MIFISVSPYDRATAKEDVAKWKRLKRKQALKRKIQPVGERKRKKASKVSSITKLIKEADRIVSEKVRGLNGKKDRTFGVCFTCGARKLKRKMDCGHYISRRYKFVRWHFDNVRPQCKGCNGFNGGEPIKYRRNLIKEIGEERVKWLEENFDRPVKITREYLENLIEKLKTI